MEIGGEFKRGAGPKRGARLAASWCFQSRSGIDTGIDTGIDAGTVMADGAE